MLCSSFGSGADSWENCITALAFQSFQSVAAVAVLPWVLIPCCGPRFQRDCWCFLQHLSRKWLLFFFPEVSNCLLIFQHIKSIIIIVPDICWLCQGLRKIKPSRSAVLNRLWFFRPSCSGPKFLCRNLGRAHSLILCRIKFSRMF